MARIETETIVAPGHVVWGGIENSESESGEDEITYTAQSTVSETPAIKSIVDQPSLHLARDRHYKVKAPRRHQSRTPSPDARDQSSLPIGRKPSYNSVDLNRASPLKGSAQVLSDDEDQCATPRARTPSSCPFGKSGYNSVNLNKAQLAQRLAQEAASASQPTFASRAAQAAVVAAEAAQAAPSTGAAQALSDDEDVVATPRVRTLVPAQTANTEVNFLDELDAFSHDGADEEANLSEAAEEAEEEAEEVAGKTKKKKASRPFRATRVRYRKFMNEQYSAIANDPLTFDLATVDIPRCISKEKNSEAKVLLKLYLRAEQARLATLQDPNTVMTL